MIFVQSLCCLFCLKSTKGLFTTKLLSFWKTTIFLRITSLDLGKVILLHLIRDDILKAMNWSECTTKLL
ncbi:unnamed protein product, partial [Porites lobata]